MAVPAVAEAVPSVAVQFIVLVPQPGVIVIVPIPFSVGVNVRGPVPVRVNTIGAIAVLTLTLWVPPEVIEMVGAGGLVTVIPAW